VKTHEPEIGHPGDTEALARLGAARGEDAPARER
jgi:hypothetical protein